MRSTTIDGESNRRTEAQRPDRGRGAAARVFAVVDTEVEDPKVSAKKSQKQNGKQIVVKVTAGAGEPVDLLAGGKIAVKNGKGRTAARAGSKSFKMKSVEKSAAADKQTVLSLKPAKKGDSKKIFKLLRKGADLRANLSVKLTDEAGNSVIKKPIVRLKAKK